MTRNITIGGIDPDNPGRLRETDNGIDGPVLIIEGFGG